MIVAAPTGRPWQPNEPRPTTTTLVGLEVVVVVPGLYNGPNHKSLGHCEAGKLITVAPGPYAEYLLAHGLVEIPGEAQASPQPAPPSEPRSEGTREPATVQTKRRSRKAKE